MCAESEAKIRDEEVDLYMGYNGGWMQIGKHVYNEKPGAKEREDFSRMLNKYKKTELVNLILDLLDNSCEG